MKFKIENGIESIPVEYREHFIDELNALWEDMEYDFSKLWFHVFMCTDDYNGPGVYVSGVNEDTINVEYTDAIEWVTESPNIVGQYLEDVLSILNELKSMPHIEVEDLEDLRSIEEQHEYFRQKIDLAYDLMIGNVK